MASLDLTYGDFQALAREEKPVLVDFWAPWCSYCRRIGPAYEKIAEEFGEELVVAKVNIDNEPRFADAEQIEVIPTLVLYRGGKALGSVVAPTSKGAIESFIRETLEK
ncbi:MAG: thioredoxin family protein [Ruminococcaceae bacterium]|nr:thioredoxin family protein [Oscillospiraceae bacterium]